WAVCMDLVAAAEQGFETVDADPVFKRQAVEFLRKWLSGPEFAPYRPQIEWQISSAKWADLLDAFYQVLPFGTGGRRRGGGAGRRGWHRAEPDEPVDARRFGPGALRVPQGAIPRRDGPEGRACV